MVKWKEVSRGRGRGRRKVKKEKEVGEGLVRRGSGVKVRNRAEKEESKKGEEKGREGWRRKGGGR